MWIVDDVLQRIGTFFRLSASNIGIMGRLYASCQVLVYGLMLCLLCSSPTLQAQPKPPAHVRLLLVDDTELFGEIIKEDDKTVWLQTATGLVMWVPADQIRERENFEPKPYVPPDPERDPNRGRLLFFPTARSLKPAQIQIAVHEAVLPSVTVGVTQWLDVSIGSTLLPKIDSQILFVAPKFTPYHSAKVSLAVGGLYFKALGNEDGLGIAYVAGTFDKPYASATLGAGYGFASGSLESGAVFFVGGALDVFDGFKLITENWLVPAGDSNSIVSGGVRFYGRRLAVDVAVLYPLNSGLGANGIPFLPWLGVAYTFGKL